MVQLVKSMMSDLWDVFFEKTVQAVYCCSAIYFLFTATIEGYFLGFLIGLVTALILPFGLIVASMGILLFGLGYAVIGFAEFYDTWIWLRSLWLFGSALNIWLATIWKDDNPTLSEVWEANPIHWGDL